MNKLADDFLQNLKVQKKMLEEEINDACLRFTENTGLSVERIDAVQARYYDLAGRVSCYGSVVTVRIP